MCVAFTSHALCHRSRGHQKQVFAIQTPNSAIRNPGTTTIWTKNNTDFESHWIYLTSFSLIATESFIRITLHFRQFWRIEENQGYSVYLIKVCSRSSIWGFISWVWSIGVILIVYHPVPIATKSWNFFLLAISHCYQFPCDIFILIWYTN